jgi:hypothetical protein
MDPSELAALVATLQALAIEVGLLAWRIEREVAAHDGAAGSWLLTRPDPDTLSPPTPNRRRLPRVQRAAP